MTRLIRGAIENTAACIVLFAALIYFFVHDTFIGCVYPFKEDDDE